MSSQSTVNFAPTYAQAQADLHLAKQHTLNGTKGACSFILKWYRDLLLPFKRIVSAKVSPRTEFDM